MKNLLCLLWKLTVSEPLNGETKSICQIIEYLMEFTTTWFFQFQLAQILKALLGTVISSSYDTQRFGKTITIEHSNIVSFYGHIDTSFVSIGQKVNCGDIIGRTGSSGRTAGPNLYFKVTKDSISINPMEKIK